MSDQARIIEALRDCGYLPITHDGRYVAEQILNALRPVIETVDQLDALPDGSVVFDGDQDVMVKYDGQWRFWGVDFEDDDTPGEVYLPARVVYTPEVDR